MFDNSWSRKHNVWKRLILAKHLLFVESASAIYLHFYWMFKGQSSSLNNRSLLKHYITYMPDGSAKSLVHRLCISCIKMHSLLLELCTSYT